MLFLFHYHCEAYAACRGNLPLIKHFFHFQKGDVRPWRRAKRSGGGTGLSQAVCRRRMGCFASFGIVIANGVKQSPATQELFSIHLGSYILWDLLVGFGNALLWACPDEGFQLNKSTD